HQHLHDRPGQHEHVADQQQVGAGPSQPRRHGSQPYCARWPAPIVRCQPGGMDDRAPHDRDAPPGAAPAGAADVGVGPWEGPWPDDPRYDPELLAAGDRRNVVDTYRYWSVAAIRADLATRRHPFHVAIENWRHDLNIGTVVRTANAFNAAGVHI